MHFAGERRPSWNEEYQEAFRRDTFELLDVGYRGVREAITADTDETVISSLIVDAIEDYLAIAPRRLDRYSVQPERPVRSVSRLGRWRRRIDIYIEATGARRTSFSIEAKRLRDPTHTARDYVGPEGLELFVNGEYGAGESEAGFLGYIQSGSSREWYGRLAAAISADHRNRLNVLEQLTVCMVHPNLVPSGRSRHARRAGGPVCVYHVLLDCV